MITPQERETQRLEARVAQLETQLKKVMELKNIMFAEVVELRRINADYEMALARILHDAKGVMDE